MFCFCFQVGVGNASDICKDPKSLYERAKTKIDILGLEFIRINTFEGPNVFDSKTYKSLAWKEAQWNGRGRAERCFTLTIPNKLIREGISELTFKSKKTEAIFLHQKGLYRTDMMPESTVQISAVEIVSITHEQINVLDFDGETCDSESNYRLDLCKNDVIVKVGSS